MKVSFQAAVALFWLLFWTAQIMVNYQSYMRYDQGRLFLLLYGIAVLLGALFMGYLAWKSYSPKMLYNIKRDGRCPDCYSKLGDSKDFCPKCGKDLRERDESRTCWNCGYEELNKSATSCPKCGREYKK